MTTAGYSPKRSAPDFYSARNPDNRYLLRKRRKRLLRFQRLLFAAGFSGAYLSLLTFPACGICWYPQIFMAGERESTLHQPKPKRTFLRLI
jgi:hypothetical protein